MFVATRYATHQEVECKYVKGGLAVANKIDDIFGKADRTADLESCVEPEVYAQLEVNELIRQNEYSDWYQSLSKWGKLKEDIRESLIFNFLVFTAIMTLPIVGLAKILSMF